MQIATLINVPLSTLQRNLEPEQVEEGTPLYWGDCDRPPLVERGRKHAIGDIIDGFHRSAGFAAYAAREGLEAGAVEVPVIVVHDEELIQKVCHHGMEDDDCLDQIYEAAGLH